MIRLWRWSRAHKKLVAALVVASAALLVNAIAFFQEHAMTHFTEGGARTERPESLSLGQRLRTLVLGVNVPRPKNAAAPDSFGLRYSTHTFATEDGIKLEAWDVPRDDSRGLVVIFHGYAASKSAQLPVAAAFHDLGYETLLVDFRGSGGSAGNVTTLGAREADDVRSAVEFAARLRANSRPILFGTSMGSVAILRAIHVHRLEPKAVILECPFGRMLDTVRARFALMGVPAFPGAQLLVFWGGVEQGFNGFEHNPVEYAASVRCPTLHLQGEADATISMEQAREIDERLAGPHTFKTFPGVGHESYLTARPNEWRSAVANFVSGLR